MFISEKGGMSIPAVEFAVDWSQVLTGGTTVDVSSLISAVDILCDKALALPIHSFGAFKNSHVSASGLSLHLTSPLTVETRCVVRIKDCTTANFSTKCYQAPSFTKEAPLVVQRFYGLWAETILSAYVGTVIRQRLATILANGSTTNAYGRRAAQLQERLVALRSDLGNAFVPVSLLQGDSDDFSVSTPGYAWPDSSARFIFDHAAAARMLEDVFVVNVPAEAVSAVRDKIRQPLVDGMQGLMFGVVVGAVVTRQLSASEITILKEQSGFFFASPIIALDIMGQGMRNMNVPSMLSALQVFYTQYGKHVDIEPEIDLDYTARTLAELIRNVSGNVDARFLDSVDAFYRRRELPIIEVDTPPGLVQQVTSVHPALLPNASIDGRTVTYTWQGKSYVMVFPDRLGSGYTFTTSNSAAAAYEAIRKLNDFIQAGFVLLSNSSTISPAVLKNFGISGVQGGWVFGQRAT